MLSLLCITSDQIIINTILTSQIMLNRNPAHSPRGYGPSLTTPRRVQLVDDVPGSIKTNWLSRWISSVPNSVERQTTSPPGARYQDDTPDELEPLVDGATAEQRSEHETNAAEKEKIMKGINKRNNEVWFNLVLVLDNTSQ